jgi:hypothetical protein
MSDNFVRALIIVALIVIIWYYRSLYNSGESFVSGVWEGDEGLYRARARAYQWCPPGGCENKKVEAKDLVSFNPFRWPNSGGYYFGTLNQISYDKPLFEKDKQEQDHLVSDV